MKTLTRRKTISIPPDLGKKAAERARMQKRSFSNYVQVLIQKDLENPTPTNLAFSRRREGK